MKKRVPALDGLRGLAIAAVVAFHVHAIAGGFLGVDLFFVLSGYLITGLLLHEQAETGRVALQQFWTRRAKRLVPAVLALLVAAQLWTRTVDSPSQLPTVNGQTLAALVYASNWYNIFAHIGYWDAGLTRSPLNHLWSLGIEEQYYLLFPLLAALLLRWQRFRGRAFALVTGTLAVASLALTPALYAMANADRAYFGTDSRAGAILLGATLAALAKRGAAPSGGSRRRNTVLTPLLAIPSLTVIGCMWYAATTAAPWLYQGGFALHAVAGTLLIASVTMDENGFVARAFSWRPLVWLGERSYSLYLWHWPLLVVLSPLVAKLNGVVGALLLTAAIALATLVSYHLIENPVRYSRQSGRTLALNLAFPAGAIAVSAAMFQPAPPPEFGSEMLSTEGHGGLRILVAGDSWARNLGIAIAEADSAHRSTVYNMGKGGCGIANAVREMNSVNGLRYPPADCQIWPVTWPAIMRSSHPDVAVLTTGTWDQVAQDLNGSGTLVRPCDASFAETYAHRLDDAIGILSAGGVPVYVTTVRDNDGREGSIPDCMNRLLEAAVIRNASRGARLLDLYGQLCRDHVCPDSVDGERVYDESGHLRGAAQRRIGRWVLNRLYADRRD